MSKVLKNILLVGLGILIIFIGMLYYVLRTKITDVSDERPYSVYLNKELDLKRDAVIAKSRDVDLYTNPYILVASDSLLMDVAKPRYVLPKGTIIKLNKANIYQNGSSGFKCAYVLGTVYIKELKQEVAFEYNWGDCSFSLDPKTEEHWTFPLALWQVKEIDEEFYFK